MSLRFSVRKSIKPLQGTEISDRQIDDLVEAKMQSFTARDGFAIEKNGQNIARFADWIRFYQTLDMHSLQIKNVHNPTDDQDVATKIYVDRKCDIYTTLDTVINNRVDYQKVQLNAERISDTTLDRAKSGINLLPNHFYRILVVGTRTFGQTATIRLLLGLQALTQMDLTLRQTAFDFSAIISLQEAGILSFDAKKNSAEDLELKATIIIERI